MQGGGFFVCADDVSHFIRILHYAQNHDIQTAAMLCCAFGRHCPPNEHSRSSSISSKSIAHSVRPFISSAVVLIVSVSNFHAIHSRSALLKILSLCGDICNTCEQNFIFLVGDHSTNSHTHTHTRLFYYFVFLFTVAFT